MNLQHLISPVDVEAYKRDYWETKCLVVNRSNTKYYNSVFTMKALDELLSSSSIPLAQVRIVQDGATKSMGDTSNFDASTLEAIYKEYREGATINLMSIEARAPGIGKLCESLTRELNARFRAGVYLTPPFQKGLALHHDTHSVFVLQIEGVKHWQVYEPTTTSPLPNQFFDHRREEPGMLVEEFELRPGDLAYVPRGFPHRAFSTDTDSLHLTVGAHVVTWAHIILNAIGSLVVNDERYREALPLSFTEDGGGRDLARQKLTELLEGLFVGIDPDAVTLDAIRQTLLTKTPELSGHLRDLIALRTSSQEMKFRLRPDLDWMLDYDEEYLWIYFHGKSVRLPIGVAPAILFIVQGEWFSPDDLPGDLDDSGKTLLTRQLAIEGLLTVLSS